MSVAGGDATVSESVSDSRLEGDSPGQRPPCPPMSGANPIGGRGSWRCIPTLQRADASVPFDGASGRGGTDDGGAREGWSRVPRTSRACVGGIGSRGIGSPPGAGPWVLIASPPASRSRTLASAAAGTCESGRKARGPGADGRSGRWLCAAATSAATASVTSGGGGASGAGGRRICKWNGGGGGAPACCGWLGGAQHDGRCRTASGAMLCQSMACGRNDRGPEAEVVFWKAP